LAIHFLALSFVLRENCVFGDRLKMSESFFLTFYSAGTLTSGHADHAPKSSTYSSYKNPAIIEKRGATLVRHGL
jgi:hypothetical protein